MYNGFKKRYGDLLRYDVEDEITRFKQYRKDLAPMVVDAVEYMVEAQKKGLPILIEGANAIVSLLESSRTIRLTATDVGHRLRSKFHFPPRQFQC